MIQKVLCNKCGKELGAWETPFPNNWMCISCGEKEQKRRKSLTVQLLPQAKNDDTEHATEANKFCDGEHCEA